MRVQHVDPFAPQEALQPRERGDVDFAPALQREEPRGRGLEHVERRAGGWVVLPRARQRPAADAQDRVEALRVEPRRDQQREVLGSAEAAEEIDERDDTHPTRLTIGGGGRDHSRAHATNSRGRSTSARLPTGALARGARLRARRRAGRGERQTEAIPLGVRRVETRS